MADDGDNAHSLLSPSGAKRWTTCHGSLALEKPFPRSSSKYAAEGTAAHQLAEWCLTSDESPDAEAFLGRVIEADGYSFTVDDDMARHVNTYVTAILAMAEGNTLMVEQKLAFGSMIGQPDEIAFGTSDVVILAENELQVHDLKYGQGVRVDADENEQLMLYALGAMAQFELAHDFEQVRLVIHQPRLNHVSEWLTDVGALRAFATDIRMHAKWAIDLLAATKAGTAIPEDQLVPSEDACRFCKAKPSCPALGRAVRDTVSGGSASADDFEDLTVVTKADIMTLADDPINGFLLGQAMDKVGLIEDWCKAIRSAVETRLLEGKEVTGYKLVEGRRGNRKWSDPAEAEALLKGFRLKDEAIYTKHLIGIPAAEVLLKDNPKRWTKVEKLITQSAGSPSVAPVSDKRPAISTHATADDFEAVEDGGDLC